MKGSKNTTPRSVFDMAASFSGKMLSELNHEEIVKFNKLIKIFTSPHSLFLISIGELVIKADTCGIDNKCFLTDIDDGKIQFNSIQFTQQKIFKLSDMIQSQKAKAILHSKLFAKLNVIEYKLIEL